MSAITDSSAIPDHETLKDLVRKEIGHTGMSQSRLAKESGITQARLSQWFSGTYRGNNEAVAQELFRWLKARQQQKNGKGFAVAPEWLLTPTAQNIFDALQYAQRAGDIALIYGGAGLGKTCTARRYQEDYPNVWIATMTPAMNTVAACLERIAFAVGLPEAQPSAVKTENAIISRLEGTSGLLIVDEAQHLHVSGLEAIRSIHDATGVGLALMGNETVYARITGGMRQSHFAQIFSRVGYKLRLTTPTPGDIEIIVARWNVQGEKGRGLCAEIAKQAGALRGLTKVLKLATAMLGEDEPGITLEHIQTAWARLGGAV